MKKTLKTAMTAAMFAASLGASATTAMAAGDSNADLMQNISAFAEAGDEPQDVYGPPPVMTTTGTTTIGPVPTTVYGPPHIFTTTKKTDVNPRVTTTKESLVTERTMTTTRITSVLYGPPYIFTTTTATTTYIPAPLYGPPPIKTPAGDLNGDYSVDARDLSLLKRAVLNDERPYYRDVDLSRDNKLDKKDVEVMERLLLGKTDKYATVWRSDEFRFRVRLVPYFSEDADKLSYSEQRELCEKGEIALKYIKDVTASSDDLNVKNVKVPDFIGVGAALGDEIIIELENPYAKSKSNGTWYTDIPDGTDKIRCKLNCQISKYFSTAATAKTWVNTDNQFYLFVETEDKNYYYDKAMVELNVNTGEVKVIGSKERNDEFPYWEHPDSIIPQPTYGPPIANEKD